MLQISLLHVAALRGWVDIIIDLITKYKCDTNCKDFYGRTPLHYAAISNHLEVVRYFINDQHCDPMTRDDNRKTLFYLPCSNGHLNIAQYLITVTHHVRTMMVRHHFTMLVAEVNSASCSAS